MKTWTAATDHRLLTLPTQDRLSHLPQHLRDLVQFAMKNLSISRIYLFGSRARGDARENSDFDLAFEVLDDKNWSRFVVEAEENTPSLYRYDLVNFNKADIALKKAILNEGVIIYE